MGPIIMKIILFAREMHNVKCRRKVRMFCSPDTSHLGIIFVGLLAELAFSKVFSVRRNLCCSMAILQKRKI